MDKGCYAFEVSRVSTIQGFQFIYVPLSGFEQSLRTEYTGDAHWATHHDGGRISPESKHLLLFILSPEGKLVNDAVVCSTVIGPETEYLLLFIFSPEGKMVSDAVVCSTVIGPETDLRTARTPFLMGGYAVDLKGETTGVLRIEMKVEIASQLLTDEFGLWLSR